MTQYNEVSSYKAWPRQANLHSPISIVVEPAEHCEILPIQALQMFMSVVYSNIYNISA